MPTLFHGFNIVYAKFVNEFKFLQTNIKPNINENKACHFFSKLPKGMYIKQFDIDI